MKEEKIEIVYSSDDAGLRIGTDLSDEEELGAVACCAASIVRDLTEEVTPRGKKKTIETLRGLILEVMQDNLAVQGEKEEA